MWIILLLFVSFTYGEICKPMCNNVEVFNNVHQLMNELQEKVNVEIEILEIELKMIITAKTIEIRNNIDDEFKTLFIQHQYKIKLYENLLASISLSPAREDEIYKIVEMEKASIIQSIYGN
jgi:hypothetical protein